MNIKKSLAKSKQKNSLVDELFEYITVIIGETNGITLSDTLDLMHSYHSKDVHPNIVDAITEFRQCLADFQINKIDIETLLAHPFSQALYRFFQTFPLRYHDNHIHLTGSLSPEFVYPRLQKLLSGKNGTLLSQKIEEVYGSGSAKIKTLHDVENLLRMKKDEDFHCYLKKLFVGKLLLGTRKSHAEAAYSMAHEVYSKYNIGSIHLKFTLSRANATRETSEYIPGMEHLTPEDVILGLYDGFSKFQKKYSDFHFILSPAFRKEPNFFDATKFSSKREDVEHQVAIILKLLEKYPYLQKHLTEIDTLGDEREFYRKKNYLEMKQPFRKLQYQGFAIRSHHGEVWKTLRRGIQAVDNAINIWHIDTLEHGLALGINPNFYFHSLFERLLQMNRDKKIIQENTLEYHELMEMEWDGDEAVLKKLIRGVPLTDKECIKFTKAKFHTAREIEHYQHDTLNRMIHKQISLVALPSSNRKLTRMLRDYKDHPFSWWEKKGIHLGVGTDNYVALHTDFIKEMLILLYTDPRDLKITKLLMITTGEMRRPYMSRILWDMRKMIFKAKKS